MIEIETFRRNVAVLAIRYPDLAEEVRAAGVPPVGARLAETARAGAPTIRIQGARGPVHVYSARDPVVEAERWAAQAVPRGVTLAVVPGFGLGYPAQALLGHMPPGGMVVALEPRLDLLRLALAGRQDLHRLISDPRLVIVAGASAAVRTRRAYTEALDRFIGSAARTALLVPPSAQVVPAWSDPGLFESFRRGVHSARECLGDDPWDSLLGLDQVLANAEGILRGPQLAPLEGRFQGVPAICVAAGPSLEADLPALRAASGRAVILAADTVLTRLIEEGIVPDLTARHERGRAGYEMHLARWADDSRVRIVARGVAEPMLYAAFGERVLAVASGGDPWERWFVEVVGDLPVVGRSLRSVAHLNLGIARFLGCDPVILVGQDLAYGEAGAAYVKGTAYDARPPEEAGQRIAVPANDGGVTWTNARWDGFRAALEREVGRGPGRTIVTAPRGARVAGTHFLPLETALARYGRSDFPRLDEILQGPMPGTVGRSIVSLVAAIDRVLERNAELVAALTRGRSAVLRAQDEVAALRGAPAGPARAAAVEAIDRVVTAVIDCIPEDPFFRGLGLTTAIAARQRTVAAVADEDWAGAIHHLETCRRKAVATYVDLAAVLSRHRARLTAVVAPDPARVA